MTTPHDSPADLLRRSYTGDGLDRLEAIRTLILDLTEQEDSAALAARADGATWQEVADALDTTRQAAHQRWGRIDALALTYRRLGATPGNRP